MNSIERLYLKLTIFVPLFLFIFRNMNRFYQEYLDIENKKKTFSYLQINRDEERFIILCFYPTEIECKVFIILFDEHSIENL